MTKFMGLFTPGRGKQAAWFVAGTLLGGAVMNGHTTQDAVAHVSDLYGQKAATVVVLKKELKAAKVEAAPTKSEKPVVLPAAPEHPPAQ